jgi:hypothetical protein
MEFPTTLPATRIIDSRHPNFLSALSDWEKWRLTYRGGEEFRNKYLERFTTREDVPDFNLRRAMTPIPAFGKAAINDIRNSIFQRMRDITRIGGTQGYQNAVNGLDLGVDRRGNNMNAFLGMKVLTELLVMGRCGVFVDNSIVIGETVADAQGARPYLYSYQAEDILSWSCTKADDPSEFQSLLLRDTALEYDRRTMLPLQTFQRFRLLWIDELTGRVNLQFMDSSGLEINRDGSPGGPIELELTRIPFVMLDIGDSLIKDVCQHQIALLNLVSSDVNYALKGNFPFYVEQRDMRALGSHLKVAANADGTATQGGQAASDTDIKVGVTQGRAYDKGANAPAFINPSSEPLKASMELQAKLEADIRKLVNLAVASLSSRSSAESKSMDNQGLEAGLSFIGLVLESAERRIAEFWAAYEERNPSRRSIATIKYPDRYSLKTDADRIDEAGKLSELMYKVPGRTVKREIAKSIVNTLLSGKTPVDRIDAISKEIDAAKFTTSDPTTIIAAKEAGLVGTQTASIALGFDDDEYQQAEKDFIDRVSEIAKAQAAASPKPAAGDPGARGVKDLSADPANAGSAEKAASRNTDLKPSTKKPVRGEGK